MQRLVGVYYQLHNNGANYLRNLRTDLTFLNPNPDEVYDMITSILEFILLIVSGQKLADLPCLYLFLQSHLAFSPD